MSGDVNDGEELYTDGTSITNITVLGVKDKIAMFGTGAKPGVANKPLKPVMQRFQQNVEQNNVKPSFIKTSPTSKGTPVKTFGSKVAAPAVQPKSPSTSSPATQSQDKSETVDQNKNITPGKRGSLNIPNAFRQNSKPSPPGRKISIEEKPVVQNGLTKSPETPKPPEPSVNKKDDEPELKNDLRANLRPVSKGVSVPKAIEINPRQRQPSVDDKSPLPPGGPKSTPTEKPALIPKRITPMKSMVVRKDDGKKFEKLAKSVAITTELAPIKPLKPMNVSKDISDIIAQFKKAYEDFKYANEELYDDVGNFIREEYEEEEYDDVANVVEQRPGKRTSRPVSQIPEWTEEEELGSGGSVSGSGGSAAISAIQEDTYDDGTLDEEVYEPLDEEISGGSSVEIKKEQQRREKEDIERKKREEKEKREQEKRDKAEQARKLKEEKNQLEREKKKEKEEKELKKKLKITGDEQAEAQGVVKEKSKGGKLDLAVEAGERLDIIRMTDTPKGKWVVRNNSGAFGYVDMKNINIETNTIKKAGRNV